MSAARVHLTVLGQERVVEADVATGKVGLTALLPLAERLVSVASEVAADTARAEGRTVTCRKGCGACCRQIVPIAPVEAVRLAELVERMDEPKRTRVRRRFAEALTRMSEIGVRPRDAAPGEVNLLGVPGEGRTAWEDASRRHFEASIACPFLEDEACSIHQDRPLVCREYSVTSDPASCRSLDGGAQPIDRPLRVVEALARLGHEIDGTTRDAIPLTYALDWAAVSALSDHHDGEALFHRFVGHLLALQEE